MKKFLLSAGALLLAVGLGLTHIGLTMGGETMATVRLFGRSWNVYAPTASGWGMASAGVRGAVATPSPSLVQAVEEPPVDSAVFTDTDGTSFSSIHLDVDLGDVTIVAGDDYVVEIESWGAGYQVNHWYSGDTLYIENSGNGAHLTNCGSNITVYVPAGVWLEDLYVDLDLGSLTLAGLQIKYANIDLDLGSLTGEALTVTTTLEVEANLGEVTLYGDLGENVDISADLGSVQLGLTRPSSEYSWQLEADLGSVTVDGKSQRLNDDHEATGGHGSRMIEVDADLGSITLDFGQDFGRANPSSEAPVSSIPVEMQEAIVTEDKGIVSGPESVWTEAAE